MRDIPYIIALVGFMIGMSIIGFILFFTNINEDSEVTQLNNLARNSAIEHIDMVSRVDIGHVYLRQDGIAEIVLDADASADSDFESTVLTAMAKKAPEGSELRFDYVVRSGSRNLPVTIYKVLHGKWVQKTDNLMSHWRPLEKRESIEAIRIQYREEGNSANKDTDDLDDPDYWSYQSTVEVDRSDFVREKMEAVNAN